MEDLSAHGPAIHPKKKGLLEDIKGIEWYSWKDTGITDALKQMNPEYVRQQTDHQKYETLLKYNHAGIVNEGMKNFKIDF